MCLTGYILSFEIAWGKWGIKVISAGTGLPLLKSVVKSTLTSRGPMKAMQSVFENFTLKDRSAKDFS